MRENRHLESKTRGLPPFVPMALGLGVLGLAVFVFGSDIGAGSYQLILALALGGVALALVALAGLQWLAWRDG